MTRSNTRRQGPRRQLDSFTCVHCGYPIPATALGTNHRNHCPRCLYSRHLDLRLGDRACSCRGPMQPIAVWARDNGELALIHRCERCGTLRSNRIAGDDDPRRLRDLLQRTLELTQATPEQGGRHDHG